MTANIGAGIGAAEDNNDGGLSLFGITLNSRAIGIILAILGVGLAIWGTVQYTSPNLEKIEKNEADIKKKEDNVSLKTQQIAAKGDLTQKVATAKQRNQTVLELLPTVDSMSTLLVDLNAQIPELVTIPNQFGLTVETRSGLKEYRPTEGAKAEQFVPNNLNIKFSGTYEDVLGVIRKIERIKPLLQMRNLKIKPAPNLSPSDSGKYTAAQQKQILDVLPPVLDVSFDLVANTPKSAESQPPAATPGQPGVPTPPPPNKPK